MSKKRDNSGLLIGGGVLMGLGIGFFFLELSPLFFLGSILSGLGLGLVLSSVIYKDKE